MKFIIAAYATTDMAFLSRPGNWGNMPFPSVEDAASEANRLAAPACAVIEYQSYRGPKRIAL